jgi:hypothetical protein
MWATWRRVRAPVEQEIFDDYPELEQQILAPRASERHERAIALLVETSSGRQPSASF